MLEPVPVAAFTSLLARLETLETMLEALDSKLLAKASAELFASPVAVAATLLKLESADFASLVAVEIAPPAADVAVLKAPAPSDVIVEATPPANEEAVVKAPAASDVAVEIAPAASEVAVENAPAAAEVIESIALPTSWGRAREVAAKMARTGIVETRMLIDDFIGLFRMKRGY